MKKILPFLFLILVHALNAVGQLVGSNCFLNGTYVNIGINNCGAYGSNTAPPAGYNYNVYSGLGFTADDDADGWLMGSPSYCGDYFVPGSPVEGWGFQIGTTLIKYNSDQYCYPNDIPGSITGYSYASGIYTATWEGDYVDATKNIHFIQETILKEGERYFVTRITVCNNDVSNISNFFYMRNVDPDQDQPWSYDFTTYNTIVNQPPSDAQALVTSEGLTYGCFLGLGSKDPNSRVSYGNFSTNTAGAKAVYDGTSGYYSSGSMTGDIANSIAFYQSTILAGECVCFSFAYVLDEDDLDEALESTLPVGFMVDGIAVGSGDTMYVTPGAAIDLDIVGLSGYTYTWSPPSGLDGTTGESVTATITTTTTYTISGDGPSCGNLTGTVTLIPLMLPIELNQFEANCNDNHIGISWETQSESNSSAFIVERSFNGIQFEQIGMIPAAGFSSAPLQYQFVDMQSENSTAYYRLKSVDKNGAFIYSQIIQVACEQLNKSFKMYAVQLDANEIKLDLQTLQQGTFFIEISNAAGDLMFSSKEQLQEGVQQVHLFSSTIFVHEMYLCRITDLLTGKQIAKKIVPEK